MASMRMLVSLVLGACLLAVGPSPGASAHVAAHAQWDETHRRLSVLYPEADPRRWRVKRYTYSRREIRRLERTLGFTLDAGDRSPAFYVAHGRNGEFLGVAIFLAPHTGAAAAGDPSHVGVGVDARGQIQRVRVFDRGRRSIAEQSEIVAAASREALVMMKIALGRG